MYFHCLIVFYMFCFWWLAVIFQQNSPNYILLTCNTMFVLIFLLSVFLKMKFFLLSFLLVSFKSWFLFVIWKRIMNNRIKFLLKTCFICLSGCNEWKTPLEPCAICGVVSLSFIFRSVLGEFGLSCPSRTRCDMNTTKRQDSFNDAFTKNFVSFALGFIINYINGMFVYTYFKSVVFQQDPRCIISFYKISITSISIINKRKLRAGWSLLL